jgi:hypothetical protein
MSSSSHHTAILAIVRRHQCFGGGSHDRSPKFPIEGLSCDSCCGIAHRGRPSAYPPCLLGHLSRRNSLGCLKFRNNRNSRDRSFSQSVKTINDRPLRIRSWLRKPLAVAPAVFSSTFDRQDGVVELERSKPVARSRRGQLVIRKPTQDRGPQEFEMGYGIGE